MNIENFCEFIKGIHTDPFKLIKNLIVRDYYALQKHLQVCDECGILVDEVQEKYKDHKSDPNFNDGKFN